MLRTKFRPLGMACSSGNEDSSMKVSHGGHEAVTLNAVLLHVKSYSHQQCMCALKHLHTYIIEKGFHIVADSRSHSIFKATSTAQSTCCNR